MNRLGPIALIAAGLFLTFGNVEGCESWSLPIPHVQQNHPGAWVIVLEETGERSKEVAAILNSETWAKIEERELNRRAYDDDMDEAKKYLDGQPLPQLLFLAADGKVLKRCPVPASVEAFDKLCKEVTGR